MLKGVGVRVPPEAPIYKKGIMKKFDVGDEIYDSMSCAFGVINEVIEVPPETNPQCWYGGLLYRHSQMHKNDPALASDFLHVKSEIGEPILPHNTLTTSDGVIHPAKSSFRR